MRPRLNSLSIRIDTSEPNYPTVRLLIDGGERLLDGDSWEGNDPDDIVGNGALLPTDPPRRIAFYGCSCGIFGCGNVAGLISADARTVTWSDFVSLTGVYNQALPPPRMAPDPVRVSDFDFPPGRLSLSSFTFDRAEYEATVTQAAADRSWETRPYAVMRHLRALRPGLSGYPSKKVGDNITVHEQRAGEIADSIDLLLPDGAAADVAERLVALLDRGHALRQIADEDLWRDG